jgi:hypothetical protein
MYDGRTGQSQAATAILTYRATNIGHSNAIGKCRDWQSQR